MRRARLARVAVVAGVLAAAGCADDDRQQSALSPDGPRAQAIIPHWNTMLWLGAAVWLLVAVAVVVTLVRRHRGGESSRATLVVALAGAVVPGLVVLGLTVQSIGVLREADSGGGGAAAEEGADGVVVEVTGHRYWWEIRYPDEDVVTANEIHIPAGERVRLELTSADVIHSVWAPELAGKVDLIPGRSNTTWLEADEPGTYWGQCAEFCGLQHARMRFVVIAHEPEEFRGWLDEQREPAAEAAPAPLDEPVPDDEDLLVARGREVFMSSSCVYCHTVAGTAAQGDVGPDLTHLASRLTLAAGTVPNERGHLAAWVVDPQSVKPGNLMPGTDLDGDELQALLAYLESLE